MLIFVDESGCSGFKFGAGSTTFFAVTAVVFKDRSIAQQCDESFGPLRHSLGLKKYKEFHFSRDNHRIRTAFLTHVAAFDFFYSSFTVNKAALAGPGFRYKGPFYKYPIGLLFENIKPHIGAATVVYDKCGDHAFIMELGNYLKKKMRNDDGSQTTIKKFRSEPSKSNNLIQLADMICGAIMWSMNKERKEHFCYRNIIKSKELEVRFWPR